MSIFLAHLQKINGGSNMKKGFIFIITLLSVMVVTGCNNQKLTGPETVSVMVGEEITLDLNRSAEELDYTGHMNLLNVSVSEEDFVLTGLKEGNGTLIISIKDNESVFITIQFNVYKDPNYKPNYDDITSSQPRQDIYYEIFVRSFADSDNDGVGDLNGITENMDYLVDLGVTSLWLMPIHPSPSYHGYDVTDYYDVNPDYGTLEDLDNLIQTAGNYGIEIILDLVINHTSDQHPWYIDAKKGPSSPYYDYYYRVNGSVYSSFVGGMMDLDHSNPEVTEEVKNIMRFYLDRGIKGFRLDAVLYLFDKPNPNGVGNPTLKNALYLNGLNDQFMKVEYPDSYMVVEAWVTNYELYRDYFLGSDSAFNFVLQQDFVGKVGGGSFTKTFVSNLMKGYSLFGDRRPDFIDATFLTNHDMNRLASTQGFINRPDKQKFATQILLTLPGNPFIYYGEELGMKGSRYEGTNIPGYGVVYDEYRRQPFLWGNDDINTTWLPSDGSNNDTDTVIEQIANPDSLYHVYKEFIQLRKDNPALMFGNSLTPYVNNNSFIQGFIRTYEDDSYKQNILVILNMDPNPRSVSIEYHEILYGTLNLDGYGVLIVELTDAQVEAYSVSN